MGSYRPFPPQSSQNPNHQYNQNWGGYADPNASSFPQIPPNSNFNHHHHHGGYAPPPNSHHYPYPPPVPPPPPPPETSYQPPPPPPPQPQPHQPMYYPSNNQYNHQPPPPPLSPPPPPSSSILPPLPPSSPPPPPAQNKEERRDRNKGPTKDPSTSRKREYQHSNHGIAHKQNNSALVPPMPMKWSNGPPGRAETEEEKRLRKKREFEKQRQEEKHRHQLKESQNTVLQKTQMLSTGKGHGSIVGSGMGEKKTTPLLSGERIENRLKKPTTFLCKLK